MEAARAAEKEVSDQRIEELSASLRREQMQCSVVEGALETARKDFARLMREAMALQASRPPLTTLRDCDRQTPHKRRFRSALSRA